MSDSSDSKHSVFFTVCYKIINTRLIMESHLCQCLNNIQFTFCKDV